MSVKERNNLKEDSTTNGPQGTVSQKTQISIELLLNGVKSLTSNVTTVNPNYKDTIDWKTLLTTIVENHGQKSRTTWPLSMRTPSNLWTLNMAAS